MMDQFENWQQLPTPMIQSRALPKHVQLTEMLIREIAAGHFADGARLPPERQMATDLRVAVGTLRKSLADLEQKGLLERIQGSGNYVRARVVVDSVYGFFRLERPGGGGLPTALVTSIVRMRKPVEAPEFGRSPIAHRIRRIRFLDGVAIAIEEIWLDTRFAKRLGAKDLTDSLYLYYKRALGLVIARVQDCVTVSKVPDWTPSQFPMKPGMPAGYVERLSWGQDGDAAEYSRTWFHPKLARYTNRLN